MKLEKTKPFLIVLTVFILLTFILFWPIFLGKVNLNGNRLVTFSQLFGENLPYKNTSEDSLRQFFPHYKFTSESLKNWQLPFWNPYDFSGHPYLASYQTAIFYP